MMTTEKTIIKGNIAGIRFQAQDTGYCVLAIQSESFAVITAAGVMPDAQKGADVEMSGEWIEHPRFGKQFKFYSYSIPEPEGEEAIAAFLCTLKGVGEATAKAIAQTFGENTFNVFEEESDRLLEVKGIGKKTLPKILQSFHETKGLSKLIGFLHKLGVSASYAKRIYNKYKEESISRIKENPYILADEVHGFGFKKADEVARGLGIAPDAAVRIQAAIMYVMKGAANMYGHCFLPESELVQMTKEAIVLPGYQPGEEVTKNISTLKSVTTKEFKRLVQEDERIYLKSYHVAEIELANKIKSLCGEKEKNSLDEWIAEYEERNSIQLANQQKEAVIAVASNNLTIITGGAGVGKSTVSKAIIQYWHSQRLRIVAAAPTGKAAQRIREATGLTSASTIHRLLGWTGDSFLHDKYYPIEADAVLIDETSMVDLKLAHALFEAIPSHATVVMVGDVNQLPSVGAGNVLRDIIESGEVPVIRLTEIFRQAATSRIIQCSLAINEGRMPHLETLGRDSGEPATDALWIPCSQGQIPQAIQWLATQKLPSMGWNQDDIQCLSPMHKGDCGNIELNKLIQESWNPPSREKASYGQFRIGDRVIQTRNDYDKRVFNGDIGKIEKIDTQEKEALIRFPDLDNPVGRAVKYMLSDFSDLMLAYSISVHKSQGCEFPVVIIPVSMQQYMMLQRNLYYTGVTRGKKLVVIVGEEKPLSIAVKTNKIQARNTTLKQRLMA